MSNYGYDKGGYRYLVVKLLDKSAAEFEVLKGFNELNEALSFYLDILKNDPSADEWYRILDTVENVWIFYKLVTEPVEV